MSSPPQFLSSLTKAILRGKHTNIHYSPVRAVPSSGQWPCQWPGGLGGLRCPRPAAGSPHTARSVAAPRPRRLAAPRLRGSAAAAAVFSPKPTFSRLFSPPIVLAENNSRGARGVFLSFVGATAACGRRPDRCSARLRPAPLGGAFVSRATRHALRPALHGPALLRPALLRPARRLKGWRGLLHPY